MSGAIFRRVPNKLSQLAVGRGGITVAEAVKHANTALDELKDTSIAIIDEQLLEIDRMFGPGNPERDGLSLDILYEKASRIIDAGGGLPDSGLDECARAVCDLVVRSRANRICDWDAIDVHIATLKVLRIQGQSLSATQRCTVLKGLSDVTAKRAGEG